MDGNVWAGILKRIAGETSMKAHVFLATGGENVIPCRLVFYDHDDNLIRFVENDEWSTTFRPAEIVGYWLER